MSTFETKKWQDWDAHDVREWMENQDSLHIKEHAVKFQRQNIFGSYLYLVNDMTLKAELDIEDPEARAEILKAIKSLLSSSEWVEPQVGDTVAVDVADKDEINGKIRFRGVIKSISPQEVYGIDLGVPEGTCDGTWLGEQYFKCEPGHGIFVRQQEIKRIVHSVNIEDSQFLSSEHAEMPDFDKDSDFLDSGLSGEYSSQRKFSHRESFDFEEFEDKLKEKFGDPNDPEFQATKAEGVDDLDRIRAEEEEKEKQEKAEALQKGTRQWVEARKTQMVARLMDKFQTLIKHFDKDKNGCLNYDELSTWSECANRKPISKEAYKSLCDKFNVSLDAGFPPDLILLMYEANGGTKQIHRDYARVFTFDLIIKVGRYYELDDGRIGKCRYIGQTMFAKGEWIGVSLIHGGGTNDGSMFNHRYFSARENHGLFVRRHKIAREMNSKEIEAGVKRPSDLNISIPENLLEEMKKEGLVDEQDWDDTKKKQGGSAKEGHKRQYTNSVVIRPDNGKYNPAIYDYKVDHGIFTERLTYSLSVLYANGGEKMPRALGPIDIGRNEDYETAEFENALGDAKADEVQQQIERKLGPVDIGWMEDFDPAKFDLNWTPVPRSDHLADGVERKLGPIEIGRNDDYDAADFDWETDEDLFAQRFYNYRRDLHGKKVERKLGPVEIGRNENFDAADYDWETSRKSDIDWTQRADHKLGPMEIGRNDDYDAAQYNWEQSDRGIDYTQKAERKMGPTDIGRNDGYDAAQYNWDKQRKGIDWSKKADRKLGPSEIGRYADYNAAQYDWDKKAAGIDWTKKADHKLGPSEIGRNADYDAAEYDWDKKSKGIDWSKKADRKLGPSEIGRNTDYSAAEYEWDKQHGGIDWSKKADRKLGPSEIGRNNGYNAAEYDWDRRIEKVGDRKADRKLGPSEIGRNTDYDAADYDWDRRIEKVDDRKADRKLGPSEIGRNTEYDAAEYNWDKEHGGIDWSKKADHKMGPSEIGRNEDYEALDYKFNQDYDFLQSRLAKTAPVNQQDLDRIRQDHFAARPNRFAKPEGYVAPKFDSPKPKQVEAPIQVERQLGPRDIGWIDPKVWKAYKQKNDENETNLRKSIHNISYLISC